MQSNLTKDLAAQSGFKTVDINGKKYTYELLPALTAARVGVNLLEMFLPAVGSAVDGFRRKDFVLPEDDNILSEIALQLTMSLGKADVVQVISDMLFNVSCGAAKVSDLDRHFQGNLSGLILLVEDTLKENFGELFLGYCKAKGFVIPSLKDLFQRGQIEQSTENSQEG